MDKSPHNNLEGTLFKKKNEINESDQKCSTLSSGIGFIPEVLSCASNADSKWFKNRPGKLFRFRPARRGESPGVSKNDWIIVYQMAPGMRARRKVRIFGTRVEVNNHAPTDDDGLSAIWNACCHGCAFWLNDGQVALRDM